MSKWIEWLSDLFSEHKRTRHTPTILQMEATECGPTSLAIILGYYHCHVPLEALRILCGVSRDGSTLYNVIEAGKVHVEWGSNRSLCRNLTIS